MVRVRRLSNVTFETTDVVRLAEYYTQVLGLTETCRDSGNVYLAGVNDHHSVILKNGAAPKCGRVCLQISSEDTLGEAEKQLAALGIKSVRESDPEPSIADALSFVDPKGTEILLYSEQKYGSQPYSNKGVVPRKLGHIAFNTTDIEKVVNFYCQALGFMIADQIEDYFIFLRCSPDHHTVNFIDSQKTKMHHVAFELNGWEHMLNACDFLGHNGYEIIWGPGRHVRGHNLFIYHRNPDGQIIELFTQLDQMNDDLGIYEPRPWHSDHPHKPKRWPRNRRDTNLWGVMPPADFMD